MPWYGLGPSPEVCTRHATTEQQAASTAALDLPFNHTTANPNTPFPGVTISPRYLACHEMDGWVAKINGTHTQYDLARTFLNRVGPAPYGWKLPSNGLYECREIGPQRKFSCFFVVRGLFRHRVELVSQEKALKIAKRMGRRG